MQVPIITDTSCLILLDKIGELDLLRKLYQNLLTTSIVANEFGKPLPIWIAIQNPIDRKRQSELELLLDKGEASAIALALEQKDCLLIIDELKGRKFAIKLALIITGTLGVILEAKKAGLILGIKPILSKISQTDFRLSSQIVEEILKEANE